MYKLVAGSVCAVLALISLNAHAALITYNATGTITSDGTGLFSGQSFSVNFTWDTDTPQSSSNVAFDFYEGAFVDLSVSIGASSLVFDGITDPVTSANQVWVYQDPASDIIVYETGFTEPAGAVIDGVFIQSVGLAFANGSGTKKYSDMLSGIISLNIDDFTQAEFNMTLIDSSPDINGAITSLAAITTVPVPAAIWLFGSGLVFLCGSANKKRF